MQHDISVIDLAKKHGVHKNTMFRRLRRLKCNIMQLRQDSNAQMYIREADAAKYEQEADRINFLFGGHWWRARRRALFAPLLLDDTRHSRGPRSRAASSPKSTFRERQASMWAVCRCR